MTLIRKSAQRLHDAAPSPDLGRQDALREVGRLVKLASGGASARSVEAATHAMLDGWGRDPLTRSELRERIEALQSDVDSSMVAADDFVAVADTKDERRQAEDQRDALIAIRRVVTRKLREMRILS